MSKLKYRNSYYKFAWKLALSQRSDFILEEPALNSETGFKSTKDVVSNLAIV